MLVAYQQESMPPMSTVISGAVRPMSCVRSSISSSEMAWAALLGALETWLPARWKNWVPSASALGIAMVIPGATALTMFVGALLGFLMRRRWPGFGHRSLTPITSGLIAGESVTGIAIALARALSLGL
jgi:uncharacterized oligopeptide transporter (OPT) family protein